METVVGVFPSYPTFLWITGCKILFIVSDQNGETFFVAKKAGRKNDKNIIKSSHW